MIVIIILIIFRMFAEPYRLSGDCMEPAFQEGLLYFVNKFSSCYRKYQIGDVVIFNYEDKDWIARVVALENDTVEINEQVILVNNVLLDDKIFRNWNQWNFGTYAVGKSLRVPLGYVYVLSDNLSAHHDDSRVFGPIAQSFIKGVVW